MYRVREARVEVCNGYTCWIERRHMAERLVSICFGLLVFWWPVTNSQWRKSADDAAKDIEADIALRALLGATIYNQHSDEAD